MMTEHVVGHKTNNGEKLNNSKQRNKQDSYFPLFFSAVRNKHLNRELVFEGTSTANAQNLLPNLHQCGEGGIRTLGGLSLNGFRDRPIQPLWHLSLINTKRMFCFSENSFLVLLFYPKIFIIPHAGRAAKV